MSGLKSLLQRHRFALGLGGVDLVRADDVSRRSLSRFFQHLSFLGSRPATVIEVAGVRALVPETPGTFQDADYLRLDPATFRPTLCLRRRRQIVPGRNVSAVDMESACQAYGLAAPFYVFVHMEIAGADAARHLRGIPPDTEIVVLIFPAARAADCLERLAGADTALRANGMQLFECLEHRAPGARGGGTEIAFVYAAADGRLAAVERQRRQRTEAAGPPASMRNCLVMGMGRSGTSMLGGILYEAGYYLGENLYPGRPSNPGGFFECAMINCLNEDILALHSNVPSAYTQDSRLRTRLARLGAGRLFNPDHGRLQGWLSDIPETVPITRSQPDIDRRIVSLTARGPFCYKDPRFSYTLPIWRRYLDADTVFICMFREPERAAASVVRECAVTRYLRGLRMNMDIALQVYRSMYRHLLRYNEDILGRIMFVHYDQLIDGSALKRLSGRLGAELTPAFVDPALSRSPRGAAVPQDLSELYARLCRLAGHD